MTLSLDSLIGDGVEAAVKLKHRRRLQRLGWDRALAPDDRGLWAAGDPPPRERCALQVLIDGAQALPEMARAMRGAQRYIHITGWHLAPHFELVRDTHTEVLGALLAELAETIDVRILVWAGAPVPAFHPTRKDVAKAVENLRSRDPEPMRDRSPGASVSLPSREDDRDRWGGRVRRRDRPHRRRRRPLRHLGP
jgi:phosphatidylserine/phosphatidylglycerophosphate/cardiolipin synthase-like enzyme